MLTFENLHHVTFTWKNIEIKYTLYSSDIILLIWYVLLYGVLYSFLLYSSFISLSFSFPTILFSHLTKLFLKLYVKKKRIYYCRMEGAVVYKIA